jgi:outer membrane protein OmpA-like peptidoglycan-associated protein
MPKQSWSVVLSKKFIALVGVSTLALSTAFAADQPPASLDQLFGIKEAPKPLPAAPAPTPESLMPSATLDAVKTDAAPAAAPTAPAAQAQPAIRDPKEDKLWQMLEQAPPPPAAVPAQAHAVAPAPVAQPEPVFAPPPPAVDAIANSPRGREGAPMNHRAQGMVSPPSAVPPIDPNAIETPALIEAAPPPPVEAVAPAPVKQAAPVKKAAKPVKQKPVVEKKIAPKPVVQAKPAAPKSVAPVAKTAKPVKKAKKPIAEKVVQPAAPASLLPKPAAEKRPDVLAATLAFVPFHSVMPSTAEAQLQQVADTLKQDATRMVELRGYADWTPNGSLEATEYLAAKRASIVKEYLQTQGIAGNRIKAVGKGFDYEGGVPRDRVEVVLQ